MIFLKSVLLNTKIRKHLSIKDANIYSEKIVEFLAKNDDIVISGTHVFAKKSISLQSSGRSEFHLKNGGSTKTDYNSIETGIGAIITGSGGAKIIQSKDGITFTV